CLDFYSCKGCQFGLTRFDLQTGRHDRYFGWHLEEIPGAESTEPYAMTRVGADRFVLAGRARENEHETLALMRFKWNGDLDSTFGFDGKLERDFGQYGGSVRGLAVAPSGRLAVAVQSREGESLVAETSFAAALFDQNGSLIWEHSPYQSHRWTMNDESDSFNYGYRGAIGVWSVPHGIIFDDRERVLITGIAMHWDLADGPVVTGEQGDYEVGTGGIMALARYLPNGVPDDRSWIRSMEKRWFTIPEDRDLKVNEELPDKIAFDLKFEGFEVLPIWRDLVPYTNKEQETDFFLSYRFPLAPWSLDNNDEAFYVKSHPLDHHHRNASGNRFAYDISTKRWDEDRELWTSLKEGGKSDVNEDHLIWGRQVRSIGHGAVVACRRAYPDNPADEILSSDANYLKIQYTDNLWYSSEREYVSFLHLQQNSIPEDLCPLACPEDNEDCDVDTEGVIVDPVEVVFGQPLGLVGNSGHSSAPHLHLHLQTGAPGAGSYPLTFADVGIGDDEDETGTPQMPEIWWLVNKRGIPHGTLLRPIY
ncbi:MAG: hypothetical protein ACE5JX_17195, partial [Acidobacteriota bacterium]